MTINPDIEKILARVVERLVETAHPERIILFGSRARGETRPDSDLDLLVVEAEPFGPSRSRLKEIARLELALGAIPVATDLLLYSREEVEQLRHSKNHIIARALREGETVYVRS